MLFDNCTIYNTSPKRTIKRKGSSLALRRTGRYWPSGHQCDADQRYHRK